MLLALLYLLLHCHIRHPKHIRPWDDLALSDVLIVIPAFLVSLLKLWLILPKFSALDLRARVFILIRQILKLGHFLIRKTLLFWIEFMIAQVMALKLLVVNIVQLHRLIGVFGPLIEADVLRQINRQRSNVAFRSQLSIFLNFPLLKCNWSLMWFYHLWLRLKR